jgi:hypothetical protein
MTIYEHFCRCVTISEEMLTLYNVFVLNYVFYVFFFIFLSLRSPFCHVVNQYNIIQAKNQNEINNVPEIDF